MAPELDYRTLAYSIARNGVVNEKRTVVLLAQGEPAPGLFEVPKDAQSVAPSAFVSAMEEHRGRKLSGTAASKLERLAQNPLK